MNTVPELMRLEELARAATPGPWGWFGNAGSQSLYLATVNRGRTFIMQFARWGMRGAQPRFQINSRMVDASELLEFEVCHAVGVDAAKKDTACYRLDVSGIASADAKYMAAADPSTILALVRVARAAFDLRRDEESWDEMNDALTELQALK